ncbi:MAG: isoleucine--tRNA ligase [Candidatus Staskawiczbacteria bacterium]|nr:isoleucine--tRNA ligase [Candidatus Staskawiczbacteria bacterium]
MTYNFPENEEKILKFWEDNKIFEKLREKNKGKKPWSFLDGPITANNPMGVHHAWGRTYKDLFCRYKAMQGFDERYQNGFDCQGLWVEVEVEKELGFKNKKDIEAYGIDKFVEKCKERVRKYSAIQTEQSIRLGQWMDWENSYYTMSDANNYAIWHFLKKCWQKGYLYKGRDSVPWCPRCGTAISQHEILTEEYKEIVHDSIYFKLPIVGRKDEYLLVWTTTPWTLPANIAVAVDEKIDYALVRGDTGFSFWVAKDLVEKIFKDKSKILKTVKGKKLVGLKYSFAFDNLPKVKEAAQKNPEKFHIVIATDSRIMPINIEDGTGLVHTAVSAGQEDFQLGKKRGLPLIEVIGEDASYLDGLGEFSGQNAKNNPKIILDYLVAESEKAKAASAKASASQGWVFEILPYRHKYPTCWRCKAELVWRVVDEWYISMKKLRKPLEEITKKINWIPPFGKERELDWLKNMHDWLISKKRYWGLALPIFECECGSFEVIGSKEELKERAVEGWESFDKPSGGNSPHRPWIDNVKIKCGKCQKTVSRIKDVGNPWLDAGIVPFSTTKYLEDKSYWKKWFPAELICESFPGQFKNWFYSLLVMSAVLEETAPVKTIFGYSSVKDEKGQEMHKSQGNAIWLNDAVKIVGADPMRWMYSKQNPAENLNFGYSAANESKRRLLTLYNIYTFFNTYVKKEELPNIDLNPSPKNVLDKWILSKTDHLINTCEFNFEKYDVAKAVLNIEDFFINDLSLWYVRRSRKRFHPSLDSGQVNDSQDRSEAVSSLYCALLNLAKLMSPIMPFFAEEIYQNLKTNNMPESVHLCGWPQLKEENYADLELEGKMDQARAIVNLSLAERSEKEIKVRQPIASIKIKSKTFSIEGEKEILELIKDEVNVKKIIFDSKIKNAIELDAKITQELKEEGIIRDVIRYIQDMRKKIGLKPEDKISISFSGDQEMNKILDKNKDFILREIKAKDFYLEKNSGTKFDLEQETEIGGQKILLKIRKM